MPKPDDAESLVAGRRRGVTKVTTRNLIGEGETRNNLLRVEIVVFSSSRSRIQTPAGDRWAGRWALNFQPIHTSVDSYVAYAYYI